MAERGEKGGGQAALVAVLAGGLATRMGAPKASARLHGRALISYPLRAAREAGLETVVVAKRKSELPRVRAPVVREPDSPRHPLCGIVSALRHAAGAPVVAVGCDMPFVSAALLRWLADAGSAADSAGPRAATATRVKGRLQPLPALYRPQDLPALEGALAAERSLRAALDALAPRVIEEDALRRFGRPERLCFSVNDPEDLRTAGRWMAG
jgi:molybdenum cofactor guanylyltransferase